MIDRWRTNSHDKPLQETLGRLSPDETDWFCYFLDRICRIYRIIRMAYSAGNTGLAIENFLSSELLLNNSPLREFRVSVETFFPNSVGNMD